MKLVVLVPGTKVPPLFVQLPVTLVVVPAVNVPEVSSTFAEAEAFTFNVAHEVKFPVVSVRLLVVNVVVLPVTDNNVPAVFKITTS